MIVGIGLARCKASTHLRHGAARRLRRCCGNVLPLSRQCLGTLQDFWLLHTAHQLFLKQSQPAAVPCPMRGRPESPPFSCPPEHTLLAAVAAGR